MAWRLRDVLRKKRWCERCGARLVDAHRCGWREIEQATAAPGDKRHLPPPPFQAQYDLIGDAERPQGPHA